MDKLTFWTVFKADLLFSLCSVALMTTLTVLFSVWKRRKLKKVAVGVPLPPPFKGPRTFMIGGTDPVPGHCPLCGQGWPLPGPAGPPREMV